MHVPSLSSLAYIVLAPIALPQLAPRVKALGVMLSAHTVCNSKHRATDGP